MNFRRWKYNCASYYYYLIMKGIRLFIYFNGENVKTRKSDILHSRIGNLSTLLPNATPLVSIFSMELSKKRQRCAVLNLENNFSVSEKFTDNLRQTKDEVALLICFLFDHLTSIFTLVLIFSIIFETNFVIFMTPQTLLYLFDSLLIFSFFFWQLLTFVWINLRLDSCRSQLASKSFFQAIKTFEFFPSLAVEPHV
jgi:hypothetical protein